MNNTNVLSTKDKMSNTVAPPVTTISRVRKTTLLTMIAVYSISALFGIIAVFLPDFDWRIIGTTALVGTGCLIVLCGLTVASIPRWKFLTYFVGALGVIAVISTLLVLWGVVRYPIMSDWSYSPLGIRPDILFELVLNAIFLSWFWTFAGLSSALLISASYTAGQATKMFSYITIALTTLVFGIASSFIFFPGNYDNYGLIQFEVVCIILTTLGFLVTITVALIQKAAKKINTVSTPPVVVNTPPVVTYYSDSPLVQASPEQIDAAFERIKAAATESNMPVDTYVNLLLKLHKMAESHDDALDY